MNLTKKYSFIFYAAAALFTLVAIILVLACGGVIMQCSYAFSSYSYRVEFSSALSLFGGVGTVKVPATMDVRSLGLGTPNATPSAIVGMILACADFVLLMALTLLRRKENEKANKILLGITYGFALASSFLLLTVGPAFGSMNPSFAAAAATISTSPAWIVAGVLLLVSCLVVSLAKPILGSIKPKEKAVGKRPKEKDLDLLLKYKALLDQGVITQEEFEKQKKELLGE